jgi:hypothetical protein
MRWRGRSWNLFRGSPSSHSRTRARRSVSRRASPFGNREATVLPDSQEVPPRVFRKEQIVRISRSLSGTAHLPTGDSPCVTLPVLPDGQRDLDSPRRTTRRPPPRPARRARSQATARLRRAAGTDGDGLPPHMGGPPMPRLATSAGKGAGAPGDASGDSRRDPNGLQLHDLAGGGGLLGGEAACLP